MRTKLLLLPFLLITNFIFAQNWELIYPQSDIRGFLTKAVITPNNTFYAIGNNIFEFDNTGNFQGITNSLTLPLQENENLRNFDIEFTSDSNAYMIYKNRIYMSTDKGITWVIQLNLEPNIPAIEMSSYFESVDFPTENTGYAVGNFEKIYKTNDGGNTWSEISWSSSTEPYIEYSDVQFINENIGFVSGYEAINISTNFGFQEFILKTTDGGNTWIRYNIENTSDFKRITLNFITEETGFAFCNITQGTEKVYVTRDGAETWEEITPENISKIKSITWINIEEGILYGKQNNDYVLLKTYNQGESWVEVSFPFSYNISDEMVTDFAFFDQFNGYAIGEGGLVMFTNDAGESWQITNNNTLKIWELEFSSENTAFGNSGTEIYKTVNAGSSWEYLEEATNASYNFIPDLKIKNENEAYLLSYNNLFLKSEDGFATIETSLLPENLFSFYKYLQLVDNTIYVAGSTLTNNLLFTSSDYGNTWEQYIISNEISGFILNFKAVNNHLIVTTIYNIFISDDNGETWNIALESENPIKNSFFIDENIGFISYSNTESGSYFKTEDSGETWNPIIVIPEAESGNFYVEGLLPLSEDIIYAFGSSKYEPFQKHATIWKSEDGGITWLSENLPVNISGRFINMVYNGENLYAIASQGEILKFNTNDLSITENTKLKKELVLYPNPASGEVFISNSQIICEMKIYTTNGKLIKTLSPNKKNFSFDISKLSAGVYFIHLESKLGVENKTLIKNH